MASAISGIFPVVITPFNDDDSIDFDGYGRLLDWYLQNGAQGLFAVCQSSEMQALSLDERVALARFTMDHVKGRIPVVASGHISDSRDDQLAELTAIAETGVDAVVLVTNRLAGKDDPAGTLLTNAKALIDALPSDMRFGLYECPAPYRRLLSEDELRWFAESGRFAFLKDVSCDLDVVKRRLAIVKGTPLAINNANAAIAYAAMQAGGEGFSGVMNNFHPDLYNWLYTHGTAHPLLAAEVDEFLVLSAMSEAMGYPKLAKRYHRRIGTFASEHTRVVAYDLEERHWAVDAVLDQIMAGADRLRGRIAALAKAA
ncbi:4-hydroxy-tetrahydrodipicolinate synthase [Fulvimarina manganoxydans]|uniref:4-hydroxy-tetrahydrodipicolinate synthase n=1 Tax=Fulvimarina manganoxydans TaxID=937218 RepID=A0A1W1YZ20_9HYPH|nr:dihydrodipicolinate synthase family protein [Fulvimarina manganoxydans]SMC40928.1 4-hydroxy-tetrahydrodipicolinate synthase [Fulvimarina manganoxydans]